MVPQRAKTMGQNEYGLVLQLSLTGHSTLSAKVLFQDGKVEWMKTTSMEVISECDS